jgi:protein TonB
MDAGIHRRQGIFGKAKAIVGQHRTSVRVGIVGVVLLAIIAFLMLHTAGQAPVHQAPVITMVTIQPQKPPPPPPPPPQQKMIVQPKMTVPEAKPLIPNQPPKAAPPKPAAPASIPMGTSIHNNGPADAFDLNGTPGGNGLLDGGGGGGGGPFDYYAGQAQTQIEDALEKNSVTRSATAGLQVKIWITAAGGITRVVLIKPSGNSRVDNAIENQVLLQLNLGAPPANMPMPISMSLIGQQKLQ